MSRPNPFDPPKPEGIPSTLGEHHDSGAFLSYLASTLSNHTEAGLSAELALDLVLNEIVEQSRLATNATGAAIALARDGEIVCRATTGTNAPDLGVRLDAHSGLSGACVQTRQWQRCDDTENDARVDAALCGRLGVRSILVFPVLSKDRLLGVIETFSSRPKAFSDREIQTLKALSRGIVENVEKAAEVQAPPPPPPPPETRKQETKKQEKVIRQAPAVTAAPEIRIAPAVIESSSEDVRPPRDYATTILTAAVIALSLLLGWMLGLSNHPRTVPTVKSKPAVPAAPPPASQAAAPPAADATAARTTAELPPANPPKKTETLPSPEQGLVVYDKGKVVFRMPSSSPANNASSVGSPGESPVASGNAERSPTVISPELASEYVTVRVEPEYPEPARLNHIQGPVVLEALVDKVGAVERLKTISGDPQLAAAATEAVRQWRFKPYSHNGRTQEFQTQITVSFRLP